MIKKEYDVKLITPLFMHGAETKGDVELRAASIKGLLRYWWRVGRTEQPAELLKNENKIFGSTEKASSFSLSLKDVEMNSYLGSGQAEFYKKNIGVKYLWYTGPVVYENKKDVYRNLAIGKFKIILKINKADYENEINIALIRLIKLGGIGGKNKRGLGRLWCADLSDADMKKVLNEVGDYNYFELKKEFSDYVELLDLLGCIYMIYRVKNKHGDENKEGIKKQFLAGYGKYLGGADNKRYPSKVVPLIFKSGNNFKGGFLIDNSNNKEEAKRVISDFSNYLTGNGVIKTYAEEVVRNESNRKAGSRPWLIGNYEKANTKLSGDIKFSAIGGKA